MRSRWRQYAAVPRAADDEGVHVVRPRYPSVPGEPRWALPDRLIEQAAWRERAAWVGANVIHGHTAMTGLAAWRVGRRAALPLVLTFHGGDLNVWPDENPRRLGDLRAAVLDASAVITVSAALAARLKALTGITAMVLPLGSDHDALQALARPRDEAREILGLHDSRVIVLFVGNLLASKGVRELVDVIVSAEDRLMGVFVGDGPERGYRADAGRRAQCVEYRGAVAHREVPMYMSAADVLVLPSHREGMPTVLVEAGSLGLPVIASGVGGIPELLGDDRGTILRDFSAPAIAEALGAFESNRSAAAAAAERLRRFVHAEHDVDTNATRLLRLYGDIAS
jgi:teichuronic acid biosynthesis glycosyltransferase TuaC